NEIFGKIQSLEKEKLRFYLLENVKGFGLKEVGHFMRNVGYKDLAILDRHILKNLYSLGVINEIPKTLNRKKYFEIEEKFREFSKKINIPMDELDLYFWSLETGKVFK
ncbi:N-glycosylase, partial [Candidatus Woesearchaeota archaeon]|nr:N-glycosylase [Candidatus Woesearchaeota archaeon]